MRWVVADWVVGVAGGWWGNEQAAFREESDIVISPHLLRSRKSRGYVSSGTSDALHLGQADDAVSSALRSSGQRNAACGLPHAAETVDFWCCLGGLRVLAG